MLNWLYRYIGKKINYAQLVNDEPETYPSKLSSVRDRDDLCSEAISFKMFKAKGGWAIEFRQYDRKADRTETSLHVINNEDELGDKISKIITYEAMLR